MNKKSEKLKNKESILIYIFLDIKNWELELIKILI